MRAQYDDGFLEAWGDYDMVGFLGRVCQRYFKIDHLDSAARPYFLWTTAEAIGTNPCWTITVNCIEPIIYLKVTKYIHADGVLWGLTKED